MQELFKSVAALCSGGGGGGGDCKKECRAARDRCTVVRRPAHLCGEHIQPEDVPIVMELDPDLQRGWPTALRQQHHAKVPRTNRAIAVAAVELYPWGKVNPTPANVGVSVQ